MINKNGEFFRMDTIIELQDQFVSCKNNPNLRPHKIQPKEILVFHAFSNGKAGGSNSEHPVQRHNGKKTNIMAQETNKTDFNIFLNNTTNIKWFTVSKN